MRIFYSFSLSVLLNLILLFSIAILIGTVPRSLPIKYKTLNVRLETAPPVEEDKVTKQLGILVKEVSNEIKPVPIIKSTFIEKRSINFHTPITIEKKVFLADNKMPNLITKRSINVSSKLLKSIPNVEIKKKRLGEKVIAGQVSKHYFQIKNIGLSDLLSRRNVYHTNISKANIQSISKRTLNYDFADHKTFEKKQLNFDELSNIQGGTITFHNVNSVKTILHSKYMQIVQNAVNNNRIFPSGKVTIEVVFYPDGLIKIISVKGANNSPTLQNLLKSSVESLSFDTIKKVVMDITYNFESKPGGLK